MSRFHTAPPSEYTRPMMGIPPSHFSTIAARIKGGSKTLPAGAILATQPDDTVASLAEHRSPMYVIISRARARFGRQAVCEENSRAILTPTGGVQVDDERQFGSCKVPTRLRYSVHGRGHARFGRSATRRSGHRSNRLRTGRLQCALPERRTFLPRRSRFRFTADRRLLARRGPRF